MQRSRKKTTADTWNRIRDRCRIECFLEIPEHGNAKTHFIDPESPTSVVAVGCQRVVYGDHGPYIEFRPEEVAWNAFGSSRHLEGPDAYYQNYYSWSGGIVAYEQLRAVRHCPNPPPGQWSVWNYRRDGYADYRVGYIYIAADSLSVRGAALSKEVCLESGENLSFKKQLSQGRAIADPDGKAWRQAEGLSATSGGYCCLCDDWTLQECQSLNLFGSPHGELEMMSTFIKPDTRIFLFNIDSWKVMGIFVATGPPQLSIDTNAFGGRFSAQVRVVRAEPLQGTVWRPIESGPMSATQVQALLKVLRPCCASQAFEKGATGDNLKPDKTASVVQATQDGRDCKEQSKQVCSALINEGKQRTEDTSDAILRGVLAAAGVIVRGDVIPECEAGCRGGTSVDIVSSTDESGHASSAEGEVL